jgi:Spy/CpxP family protein refolding chaperone
MKRIGSLMVGALLLASVPGAALAHGRPGGGGHHDGVGLLMRGADLTDGQRQQIEQIVTAHRPQFRALMTQMRAARQALSAKLYGAGTVTAADLAPELQQIEQLRSQLTQERTQLALEIRGLLTPEQLAKIAQKRQRMNELRREMHDLSR